MNRLIDKIKQEGVFRKVAKNELLLEEGARCKSIIFLNKGMFRHFVIDAEGKEITNNFALEGGLYFYSISSFLSQKPTVIQARAVCDLELFELRKDKLQEFLKETVILEDYKQLLSRYVLKKEDKEISFFRDDSMTKYRKFMIDFPKVHLMVPQYCIASYLNVSPETLSRLRKRLLDIDQ